MIGFCIVELLIYKNKGKEGAGEPQSKDNSAFEDQGEHGVYPVSETPQDNKMAYYIPAYDYGNVAVISTTRL